MVQKLRKICPPELTSRIRRSSKRLACARAEYCLSLIRNGWIVVVGTVPAWNPSARNSASFCRTDAASHRGPAAPACQLVKIAFIAPEPSVTVHMGMSSPAQTARSDLARKSWTRLGLHIGTASGLNLNPEHQTGLGSDL
jgi:hypothetical protein